MKFRPSLLPLLFAVLYTGPLAAQKTEILSSPNGKNVVTIAGIGKKLNYSVTNNGEVVLAPSSFSVTVDGSEWGKKIRPGKIIRKSVNESVSFVVPRKYKKCQNRYNEVVLCYKKYNIEFRAYDDGIAYRFVGKEDVTGEVNSEDICYNFDKDYSSYTLLTKNLQNWFEENYTIKNLGTLPQDSFSIIPAMVATDHCNILLAEANLYNYPGIYLRPNGHGFNGVQAEYPKVEKYFDGTNKIYATKREKYIVKTTLKRNFPWRLMGILNNNNDAEILKSELIYLLSDKTREDYSWIKPGKVLWDWWNHNNIYGVDFVAGINTSTYKYMIDFAASQNIEYILIDEGWSGRDNLLELNPAVDIQGICKYAREKEVGVMLWAKWINIDKQLEESFNLMKTWGIKGVKIDFMDRNDAKMVNFFERVAKKAAECHFLIDFHGSYPNEGMRAKYPLLMTREGVLGLEYNKWSERATPKHDLIIPYLRMWVGPMDYTPGAMLNAQPECFRINQTEPMSHGTRVHQLAMYVIYESPLQMLSDSPTKYMENKECFEFLKAVPSVWNETIPLFGEIGRNIGVARKSGNQYFIGIMGGDESQDIKLDLSFLPDGKYRMKAYKDGINAEVNAKDYQYFEKDMSTGETIGIHLARGGGFAAIIEKI